MVDLISYPGWGSQYVEYELPHNFDCAPANSALIIVTNSTKRVALLAGETLATIDAYNRQRGPYIFVAFQGKTERVQKKVDAFLQAKNDIPVLFDETGRLDDIAWLGSDEFSVEVEEDPHNKLVLKYRPKYNLRANRISEERCAVLSAPKLVRMAILNECVQAIGTSFLGKKSNECTRDELLCVIQGMSEGKIAFPFDDDDVEDYQEWEPDNLNDGIYLPVIAGLAESGALDISDDEKFLFGLPQRIALMKEIWNRALEMYGLPVKFDLSGKNVNIDEASIAKLAGVLGMGSLLDAADAGVPMSDLFA